MNVSFTENLSQSLKELGRSETVSLNDMDKLNKAIAEEFKPIEIHT
jgi:hypothetical protein